MLLRLWTLLCCIGGLLPSTQAATVLKIATLAPDATVWMQEMRGGAADIEQRSAGRVKLKFYPGGVMGNDQAVLRKIRIGQLQGGAITSGVMASIVPDAQLYTLPMQFNSMAEVSYVREQMDSTIQNALEQRGFVVLGIANGGFAYLASTVPIASIADLRERRPWLPQGDLIGEGMFQAADIAPVPLALSDVYTALQTGLLDTVIANPASMIAFQWHTKINYLTDVPVAVIIGMLAVDKRSFDKLQAADQALLREVMRTRFATLDELNQRDNADALATLKNRGVKVISPDPVARQEWSDIATDTMAVLADKGAYSKALYEIMQQHIQDYRKLNE